jgi:hypothetical protein
LGRSKIAGQATWNDHLLRFIIFPDAFEVEFLLTFHVTRYRRDQRRASESFKYAHGGSDKRLREIAGVLKIQGERIGRDSIASSANRLSVREISELVRVRTLGD